MSDVQNEVNVPAHVDAVELEERRANRNLKHWMVKVFTSGFLFILISSFLSLIYAAVIQEKDLDTGFLGEMFKMVFDFLRFLMS